MDEGDPCSDPDCKGTMEYPAPEDPSVFECQCDICRPLTCNVCGSTDTEQQ